MANKKNNSYKNVMPTFETLAIAQQGSRLAASKVTLPDEQAVVNAREWVIENQK